MALTRISKPSPNQSSRGGSKVRLIVVHTAEGATTIGSLGNFFASSSSGVSSHTGADNVSASTVGEYVARGSKAWTAANANPVAVQIELCGPSGTYLWTNDQWMAQPVMLDNCAQWIAEEAAYFGIPLRRLTAADAQGSGVGVCGHGDLGSWGGGHVDPGQYFPWDYVLDRAATYAAGAAPDDDKRPERPTTGDRNMVLTDLVSGGVWVCDPDSTPPGAVFSYDGAPYCGGTNNKSMNAGNYPCVGIDTNPDNKGGGYVIVLDFGEGTGGDRFRRYRFPRNGSGKA